MSDDFKPLEEEIAILKQMCEKNLDLIQQTIKINIELVDMISTYIEKQSGMGDWWS